MTQPTQAQIEAAAKILKPYFAVDMDAEDLAKAALTAAAEAGNMGKCVAAHMGGRRCVGRCMMPKDCCERPLPAAAEVGEQDIEGIQRDITNPALQWAKNRK